MYIRSSLNLERFKALSAGAGFCSKSIACNRATISNKSSSVIRQVSSFTQSSNSPFLLISQVGQISQARVIAQKGQAIFFGLILMVILASSLVLYYSTVRTVQDKTELVNAADAATYSAGVVIARELNFLAYTNRAVVANHVLTGHLVSYNSWANSVGNIWDDTQNRTTDNLYIDMVINLLTNTFTAPPIFSSTNLEVRDLLTLPAAFSGIASGAHIASQQQLINLYTAAQDISYGLLNPPAGTVHPAAQIMLQVSNQYVGNTANTYYQQQAILVNDAIALQAIVARPSTPAPQRQQLLDIAGQYDVIARSIVSRNPGANNAEFSDYNEIVDAHINSLPNAGWFNNRGRTLATGHSRFGSTSMQRVGNVLDWQANDSYRTAAGTTFSFATSNAQSLCEQLNASQAAFQAWRGAKTISMGNPLFTTLEAQLGSVPTDQCPQYTGVPSYYSLSAGFAQSGAFRVSGLFTRAIGNTESLGASVDATQTLAVLAGATVYHERAACDGVCGANAGFADLPDGSEESANLFNPFWQVRME